jgi:galactokinase
MRTRTLKLLRGLREGTDPMLRDFLAPDEPLLIARAPGRLDVMGGIADYSGSLVLQLPLDVATTAVLQARDEPTIDIVSLRSTGPMRFAIALEELLRGELRDPNRLRERLAAREDDRWAAYVVGIVHACLLRESVEVPSNAGGFRLLIQSDVPEGKGVSSSAAIEVACLSVVARRYGLDLSGERIAVASQWAENHVAGAPCGIMDQMTSACGQRDRLLRLRCQPGTIEGQIVIPEGFRFYGIDSGIRHAVTGSDYGSVRTAAFMGYRIIADLAGLPSSLDASNVQRSDARWHGYLANLSPDELESQFVAHLPEGMTGAAFLERHGGITDTVTHVRPDRTYAVRQSTVHPVYENARAEKFAELLGALRDGARGAAPEMGALMLESHASYGACGLGSDGTDRLVELVRAAGSERGLFGAKITGGGSGGTVAVLGSEDAEPLVRAIARSYEVESGRVAEVFARSGPGAAELGVGELRAGWGVGRGG